MSGNGMTSENMLCADLYLYLHLLKIDSKRKAIIKIF